MAKLHNACRVVFFAILTVILFSVSPPSTRGLPYHFVNMYSWKKTSQKSKQLWLPLLPFSWSSSRLRFSNIWCEFQEPIEWTQHFHVANDQLPQDMMHIMLEGVVPYEVQLMLCLLKRNTTSHLIFWTREFAATLFPRRKLGIGHRQ